MKHINSTSDTTLNSIQQVIIEKAAELIVPSNYIYITNANPIGSGIFDIIISEYCLIFIQYIPVSDKNALNAFARNIPSLIAGISKSIHKKLSTHQGLTIDEDGEAKLIMPFIVKLAFDKLKKDEDIAEDVKSQYYILKGQEELIFDLILGKSIEHLSSYSYKNDFTSISEEEKNVIVFVLAPEYSNAIINDNRYIKVVKEESVANSFNNNKYIIKQGDIYANAFCLDSEQIDIINQIDYGHWLVVSSAGSGKSVVLLSIGIRFAKMESHEKVLIICRNRNLANVYDWKIAQSGIRTRNIQCFNIYRFLQYILTLAEVPFDKANFDKNFEKTLSILETGKVTLPYTTIMIDEVQILREKYYKLFSYLIANAKVVCLFGDIEQDININMINKTYPWEVTQQLNFGSNIIKLEKNYRNTVNIAQYSDSFLALTKYYYENFDIQQNVFDKNLMGGIAFKQGDDPKIQLCNRKSEVEQVVKIISELKESISLSEIAVLFSYRQYKAQNYYILEQLRENLHKSKIPFTEIINSEKIIASKIGYEKGVVLATIDSILGLDFKVVILCGVSMLGNFYHSKSLTLENKNLSQDCKEEFYKSCNVFYIAITRAREQLYILLTENGKGSVYSKLLIQALKLKKRNEGSVADGR